MEDWETRLKDEVRAAADKASMRQLSDDIGMGQNYVSQLLSGKTRIQLPTLIKVLNALGTASATYILFGRRVDDAEAAEITDVAVGIRDPKLKKAALEHLRLLRSASNQQLPSGDLEG